MGLIDQALRTARAAESFGGAAAEVSEVFVPNATRALELDAEIHQATLEAAVAEFQYAAPGVFDRIINGLNRLPRPLLALGTLGLFVYAMVDPVAFSARMVGLNAVPEPLWWLLGAIVSFYFGAREMHYFRGVGRMSRRFALPWRRRVEQAPVEDPVASNPALSAWRNEAEDRS